MGSLLYSTVQTQSKQNYIFTANESGYEQTDLYGGVTARVRVGVGANVSNVVAGGYNVGINRSSSVTSGTTLQLRGRNVLTSQYNNGYVNTMSIVSQADSSSGITYSQNSTDYNASSGIVGGRGGGTINQSVAVGRGSR